MTKTDYAELRRDPRWQKRRLEIMERDEFKCVRCGDDGRTLNVHHAYYVPGRSPWQYLSFALSTLCTSCHRDHHDAAQSDDPEDFGFDAWEQEMEWLLRGNTKNADAMWDMAAHVAQRSGGHDPKFTFDEIVEFLRGLPDFEK